MLQVRRLLDGLALIEWRDFRLMGRWVQGALPVTISDDERGVVLVRSELEAQQSEYMIAYQKCNDYLRRP